MLYYSEKLNKTFSTPKECAYAEEEYEKEQKRISAELEKALEEKKAKEEALNKSKKELAKTIEDCDQELTEANNLYEVAAEKASKVLEDSNKKVREILGAAEDKVREAEEAKLNAILAFNKKFGTYTTTLTGDQAAKEFNKSINSIRNRFTDMWKTFFLF